MKGLAATFGGVKETSSLSIRTSRTGNRGEHRLAFFVSGNLTAVQRTLLKSAARRARSRSSSERCLQSICRS